MLMKYFWAALAVPAVAAAARIAAIIAVLFMARSPRDGDEGLSRDGRGGFIRRLKILNGVERRAA